jgi:hypothetical protein
VKNSTSIYDIWSRSVYAADALGLTFLPPSLATGQDFSKGVNFAVAGATALDLAYFQQNNITSALDLAYFQQNNITSVPPFNGSLSVQREWFEQLKPTLCNTTQGCVGYLGGSLFFMGEFGGNDYVFLLAANKTVEETKSYAPAIVRAIANAVEVVRFY